MASMRRPSASLEDFVQTLYGRESVGSGVLTDINHQVENVCAPGSIILEPCCVRDLRDSGDVDLPVYGPMLRKTAKKSRRGRDSAARSGEGEVDKG